MAILQGVWKQHLRPREVVGYGVKIFLPSPPNYVTRSPGKYSDFLWVVLNKYRDIFAWLKTMRRKQNLASALGIQKENWG